MRKTALIILHPGFEEIEAITPIDLLSRADIDVVQASVNDERLVEGRSGITLQTTHRLAEVVDRSFDVVILPGGPGIMALRNHPAVCQLLRKQSDAGKLTACICAAPLLLKDAGILEGFNYTAHTSTVDELPLASGSSFVLDRHILTSRGAGTATEFALAIVRTLQGDTPVETIADSICWPHPTPSINAG
ncbi:MAG: DJ-1 family glyoxalase III [Opitutaceae bacterium]